MVYTAGFAVRRSRFFVWKIFLKGEDTMKKTLCMLMALVMLFTCLAGCGAKETEAPAAEAPKAEEPKAETAVEDEDKDPFEDILKIFDNK